MTILNFEGLGFEGSGGCSHLSGALENRSLETS